MITLDKVDAPLLTVFDCLVFIPRSTLNSWKKWWNSQQPSLRRVVLVLLKDSMLTSMNLVVLVAARTVYIPDVSISI